MNDSLTLFIIVKLKRRNLCYSIANSQSEKRYVISEKSAILAKKNSKLHENCANCRKISVLDISMFAAAREFFDDS